MQTEPGKCSIHEQSRENQQDDQAKIAVSEAEWRKKLTPEQFHVMRQHGTERAFSHPYYNDKRDGMYRCVCCGAPLFSSDTKFNSGTGWPSFMRRPPKAP